MSDELRASFAQPKQLGRGLNGLRSAALVASLVPLAQVAVAPVTVSAQCSGCPPPVPEPATLLMLAPAAAWVIRRRLR